MFLTLIAGLVLFAGQSKAGTLDSATWKGAFQGVPFTLTIGSGTVGGVGSSMLHLVVSGTAAGNNVVTASVSVIPFTTSKFFEPPPAALTITQMLGGNQKINVAGNVASATGTPNMGALGTVNVFMQVGFPLLLLGVPLNVGGTGVQTYQGFNPLFTHVTVTATFLGWQIAPFTVTGLTNQGVALPNVMFTGSNNLMFGEGTVTLVAPARVAVCVGGGTTTSGSCTGASLEGLPGLGQFNRTASSTTLKLTFIPEPGVLLLLGAGLAFVGRRSR